MRETRGSGSGGACALLVRLSLIRHLSFPLLTNTLVLIIVIIAAGVVAWYFTAGPGAHKAAKRFVITDVTPATSHRVISGAPWSSVTTNGKPVMPGVDWVPGDKKMVRSFVA